eukprot:5763296-Pyramimonas_sp.AAC.1
MSLAARVREESFPRRREHVLSPLVRASAGFRATAIQREVDLSTARFAAHMKMTINVTVPSRRRPRRRAACCHRRRTG